MKMQLCRSGLKNVKSVKNKLITVYKSPVCIITCSLRIALIMLDVFAFEAVITCGYLFIVSLMNSNDYFYFSTMREF